MTVRRILGKAYDTARKAVIRITPRKSNYFSFKGTKLTYCNDTYGDSWMTERTIELPLVKHLLKGIPRSEIIEIGHVLSHYGETPDSIVDMEEKGKGVINKDVLQYSPVKKYKLAVSISTLEHVGEHKKPKAYEDFFKAVAHIKKDYLKSGGKLLFTVPIGYNPAVNEYVKNNTKDTTYFFKRVSLSNEWKETTREDALKKKYNHPYPCANAIALVITK